MQATVDVFVLGEAPEQPGSAHVLTFPVRLRLIPTGAKSLAEFAETIPASQFMEHDDDLVAIAAGASEATLRTVAIVAFSLAADSAAALSTARIDAGLKSDPTWMPVSEFGIALAARANHGPVVFRRSKLRQIGPLRPVTEPVWDWVFRAVLEGERVSVSPRAECSSSDFNRLPLLAPPRRGIDASWLHEHLAALAPQQLGRAPASKPMSKVDEIARRAGLFQWHDFLNESHELSQSIEGQGENQLGDYWHAIMHRREPDYSNAKYWFRQIGSQPTYRDLRLHADVVLADCRDSQAAVWRDRVQAGSKWNPMAFVDLCEECAPDETSDLAIAARRIQYAEMCLLMVG